MLKKWANEIGTVKNSRKPVFFSVGHEVGKKVRKFQKKIYKRFRKNLVPKLTSRKKLLNSLSNVKIGSAKNEEKIFQDPVDTLVSYVEIVNFYSAP